MTSTAAWRAIEARSVDFPTPAEAKTPIRCPNPIEQNASIDRIPVWSGVSIGGRPEAEGGFALIDLRSREVIGSPVESTFPNGSMVQPSSEEVTGIVSGRPFV